LSLSRFPPRFSLLVRLQRLLSVSSILARTRYWVEPFGLGSSSTFGMGVAHFRPRSNALRIDLVTGSIRLSSRLLEQPSDSRLVCTVFGAYSQNPTPVSCHSISIERRKAEIYFDRIQIVPSILIKDMVRIDMIFDGSIGQQADVLSGTDYDVCDSCPIDLVFQGI